MKSGYRVIDVDTHVTPSFEILMSYGDAELRAAVDELAPYVRRTRPVPGRGHPPTEYGVLRINPRTYPRIAGQSEAEPETGKGAGARGTLEGRVENLASTSIHDGVQHDNAAGRLVDMDTEGVDIDVIVPGTWACGSTALRPALVKGLYESYHRYMKEYCSADPRRLKGLALAACGDPAYAAKSVEMLANESWVAAVWPVLPEGLPVDDPSLNVLWEVMNEANLPIIHHSFFYEPPYFPGYRDIWGNMAVARTAAHMWGAQRLMSYVLISGMLDRYPNLRVGTIETGHGWLPHWLIRLSSQIAYVKGTVPANLKHTPLEYARMGRVFCAIEEHEGVQMTQCCTEILGDGVLMYSSDYPHPESQFPEHTANVLTWEALLGKEAMAKLLADNAAGFLRLSTTPWEGDDRIGAAPGTFEAQR